MKKILKMFLVFSCIAGLVLPAQTIFADENNVYQDSQGVTYREYDGYYEVSDYSGSGGEVTIPSEINGIPVTEVGWDAFDDINLKTDIYLPDSITTIESFAFSHSSGVVSVRLPSGLQIIDSYTFSDCTGLKNINLPDGLKIIDYEAFADCSSLTDITLPDGLTTLGDDAFRNCDSLKNMKLPDSVVHIGTSVFAGCSGLEHVTLPTKMSSIPMYMFTGCSSLAEISIPEDVVSIGYCAFDGCKSLTVITIPEGVRSIVSSFNDCDNLTMVTFPESIKHIEPDAFLNDSSLNALIFKGDAPEVSSSDDNPADLIGIVAVVYVDSEATGFPKDGYYWKGLAVKKVAGIAKQPGLSVLFLLEDYEPMDLTTGWTSGSLIVKPEDPTKNAYQFDGWYSDPYYEHLWDFSTDTIKDNMILYVKWEKEPTPPKVPKQLSISSNKSDGIQLNWKADTDSDGYEVYRSNTKNGTFQLLDTVTDCTYKDTDVHFGSTYYYKVRAYVTDKKGNKIFGRFSRVESWTTKLEKPDGVSAAGITRRMVRLSWHRVEDATGYLIYRSTSKTKGFKMVYAGRLTSYVNGALKANTRYYYKIKACKATKENVVSSDWSKTKCAKTN